MKTRIILVLVALLLLAVAPHQAAAQVVACPDPFDTYAQRFVVFPFNNAFMTGCESPNATVRITFTAPDQSLVIRQSILGRIIFDRMTQTNCELEIITTTLMAGGGVEVRNSHITDFRIIIADVDFRFESQLVKGEEPRSSVIRTIDSSIDGLWVNVSRNVISTTLQHVPFVIFEIGPGTNVTSGTIDGIIHGNRVDSMYATRADIVAFNGSHSTANMTLHVDGLTYTCFHCGHFAILRVGENTAAENFTVVITNSTFDVQIDNTTGLDLDGGIVAVADGGSIVNSNFTLQAPLTLDMMGAATATIFGFGNGAALKNSTLVAEMGPFVVRHHLMGGEPDFAGVNRFFFLGEGGALHDSMIEMRDTTLTLSDPVLRAGGGNSPLGLLQLHGGSTLQNSVVGATRCQLTISVGIEERPGRFATDLPSMVFVAIDSASEPAIVEDSTIGFVDSPIVPHGLALGAWGPTTGWRSRVLLSGDACSVTLGSTEAINHSPIVADPRHSGLTVAIEGCPVNVAFNTERRGDTATVQIGKQARGDIPIVEENATAPAGLYLATTIVVDRGGRNGTFVRLGDAGAPVSLVVENSTVTYQGEGGEFSALQLSGVAFAAMVEFNGSTSLELTGDTVGFVRMHSGGAIRKASQIRIAPATTIFTFRNGELVVPRVVALVYVDPSSRGSIDSASVVNVTSDITVTGNVTAALVYAPEGESEAERLPTANVHLSNHLTLSCVSDGCQAAAVIAESRIEARIDSASTAMKTLQVISPGWASLVDSMTLPSQSKIVIGPLNVTVDGSSCAAMYVRGATQEGGTQRLDDAHVTLNCESPQIVNVNGVALLRAGNASVTNQIVVRESSITAGEAADAGVALLHLPLRANVSFLHSHLATSPPEKTAVFLSVSRDNTGLTNANALLSLFELHMAFPVRPMLDTPEIRDSDVPLLQFACNYHGLRRIRPDFFPGYPVAMMGFGPINFIQQRDVCPESVTTSFSHSGTITTALTESATASQTVTSLATTSPTVSPTLPLTATSTVAPTTSQTDTFTAALTTTATENETETLTLTPTVSKTYVAPVPKCGRTGIYMTGLPAQDANNFDRIPEYIRDDTNWANETERNEQMFVPLQEMQGQAYTVMIGMVGTAEMQFNTMADKTFDFRCFSQELPCEQWINWKKIQVSPNSYYLNVTLGPFPDLIFETEMLIEFKINEKSFTCNDMQKSQLVKRLIVTSEYHFAIRAAARMSAATAAIAVIGGIASPTILIDVQSFASFSVVKCSSFSYTHVMNQSRFILSPAALSDGVDGFVFTNLVCVAGIVFLAAILMLVFIGRFVYMGFELKVGLSYAMNLVRFPSVYILLATIFYTGTIVYSIRLIFDERGSGATVLGVMYGMSMPIIIYFALRKKTIPTLQQLPNQLVFFRYDIEMMTKEWNMEEYCAMRRKYVSYGLPSGRWGPTNEYRTHGGLVADVMPTWVTFASVPFVQAFTVGFVVAVPATTQRGCMAQHGVLFCQFIFFALLVLLFKPYRSTAMNGLQVLSYLFLAFVIGVGYYASQEPYSARFKVGLCGMVGGFVAFVSIRMFYMCHLKFMEWRYWFPFGRTTRWSYFRDAPENVNDFEEAFGSEGLQVAMKDMNSDRAADQRDGMDLVGAAPRRRPSGKPSSPRPPGKRAPKKAKARPPMGKRPGAKTLVVPSRRQSSPEREDSLRQSQSPPPRRRPQPPPAIALPQPQPQGGTVTPPTRVGTPLASEEGQSPREFPKAGGGGRERSATRGENGGGVLGDEELKRLI